MLSFPSSERKRFLENAEAPLHLGTLFQLKNLKILCSASYVVYSSGACVCRKLISRQPFL
jgi:hypothetical protein